MTFLVWCGVCVCSCVLVLTPFPGVFTFIFPFFCLVWSWIFFYSLFPGLSFPPLIPDLHSPFKQPYHGHDNDDLCVMLAGYWSTSIAKAASFFFFALIIVLQAKCLGELHGGSVERQIFTWADPVLFLLYFREQEWKITGNDHSDCVCFTAYLQLCLICVRTFKHVYILFLVTQGRQCKLWTQNRHIVTFKSGKCRIFKLSVHVWDTLSGHSLV